MTNNSQDPAVNTAPNSALVQVRNLRKNYGPVEAVRDVSFDVELGQVVAIIGPSGCGKSTTLRCLNLLEEPTAGTFRMGDHALDYGNIKSLPTGRALSRFRARFGMVFQQFDLFQHKTAIENIMIGPIVVKKTPKDQARKIARDYLDRVGLAGMDDRLPKELSGGQQQRVAIARALAMSPEVLLFDEVTSALDPELVGEVLEVMQNLAKEGATMICVTHEMAFARDVANHVVFMDEGQITEQGEAHKVMINPENPRTKSFLARYHRDTI